LPILCERIKWSQNRGAPVTLMGMTRAVTISNVATHAGVHPATVSRALNPATQSQVSAETIRRVQKSAKSLGYVPNVMARGLRTKLSMTVGVIIPDLTNPIFPPVIRGIENFLAPRGYTALLANTDGRESLEQAALKSLMERRVDGLIVATGLQDTPLKSNLWENAIPVVMVNRGAGSLPFPLVTGDDASGIAATVALLKKLGHRKVVHLAGPPSFSTSKIRLEAMERQCREEGLSLRVVSVPALTCEAGERAVDTLLAEAQNFTAIQASNDLLALGALRSMRRHGLRCPEDISVIGFNDMPFAEDFNPSLTTVRVPLEEIGTESARILFENITSEKNGSKVITLPVSLIVRGSTGPAKKR
jgi:LacI family transcriptional regulator